MSNDPYQELIDWARETLAVITAHGYVGDPVRGAAVIGAAEQTLESELRYEGAIGLWKADGTGERLPPAHYAIRVLPEELSKVRPFRLRWQMERGTWMEALLCPVCHYQQSAGQLACQNPRCGVPFGEPRPLPE